MRRIVRANLPQRLARHLPRPFTEILVAVVITAVFVAVRIAAAPWLGDIAPFSMAYLATVTSALLGGWRSGAVSLVLGISLVWYFVLPPVNSFDISQPTSALSLAIAAGSQLFILGALALYQREVRAGEIERLRRINFLGHALREMDHRTKNNFQIVTSLLTMQSARSPHPEVRDALGEAAERLKAVSAVYDALAPSSQGLGTVRLQDQLQEICDQIRRGILPEGLRLEAELEPMLVPNETAVAIGIVVNELVTNACKHAFPDGSGTIRIRAVREEEGLARIEVADDGRGFTPAKVRSGGLGTRLVSAFVQRVEGKSEVHSTPAGTVHSILVPLR
ncbi:MAG TPA: histidine kinase dimerization/phosphoacceptor domain -containing protein [Allosphingosinicella sp.]